jgi:hypothetical protein
MFLFPRSGSAHRSRDVFIETPEIYEETDVQESTHGELLPPVWTAVISGEKMGAVEGSAWLAFFAFTSCCLPVSPGKRGIGLRFHVCSLQVLVSLNIANKNQ